MIPLLSLLALGQGTPFDARGPQVAPSDGDLRDPIRGFRPEAQEAMSVSFSALAEVVNEPFVMYTLDQEVLNRQVLLDDLFGINAAAAFAPHRRLQLAATMPIWVSSRDAEGGQGFAAGDLRLAAPIGLAMPHPYWGGFGASIVPFADLPTGTNTAWLGNRAGGVGGLAALSYGRRRWELSVNAGGRSTPEIVYDDVDDGTRFSNLTGGPQLLASAAGSVLIGQWVSMGLEWNGQSLLQESTVPNSQSPSEVLLSGRARTRSGLGAVLGFATGTNGAAGSAKWRVFTGVSQTLGKPPPVPGGATLLVRVIEPDGTPIPWARLEIDLDETKAGKDGTARFDSFDPDESLAIAATADGYKPGRALVKLVEGENEATIILEPPPGEIVITAKTSDGEPVDAAIGFEGPAKVKPGRLGSDGMGASKVLAGTWTVFVYAEGFAAHKAEVQVPRGGQARVDVVFQKAKVQVTQDEVIILEEVLFVFDKAELIPESFSILEEVANTLRANPDLVRVEIAGHTDNRGSEAYNLDLSQRRTETVREFLVARGVAAERLVARGYGESQLVTQEETEEAHQKNRRVQFLILERTPAAGEESP